MKFFYDSTSEKKFSLIILIIVLYILYNFFGGDRGLIEYFKKKILLNEFEEKNLEIQKEIILYWEKKEKRFILLTKNDSQTP